MLAKVVLAKFLGELWALYQRGALQLSGPCTPWQQGPAFDVLLQALYTQNWTIYAKRTFGGTEQVYAYLGRKVTYSPSRSASSKGGCSPTV